MISIVDSAWSSNRRMLLLAVACAPASSQIQTETEVLTRAIPTPSVPGFATHATIFDHSVATTDAAAPALGDAAVSVFERSPAGWSLEGRIESRSYR